MTLKDLAQAIQQEFALHADPATRVLDITSEAGELAKAVLKSTQYGSRPFTVTDNFREELGDTLFALLVLCAETGVDPDEALEQVRQKLRIRLQQKQDLGSGQ
ncbi:MazG nucleotide pyrophosphohydrolase domain-containing protein [Deinococcus cellulosilyticus]|uniref:NTP pyrophosphohydrolase MazG-like domain-containing protein n=1 Tax=Deinococcus cellulosilyticus (strain DSM 18568 / NBRC 106333 / KACC 11606 / 5516J-15) TaxID=1223518 RepID=A0A511N7U6_DEIC1|nr:MazG nucleotide pyrophosphohydrolase domain-containing protein [Deinococcus cellulosilyticus]GEM48558.1 hypothetical protein DC3_41930 [Deinococcus cellulosilyticus NBRC 106333 = KACC 11606]